MANLFQIFNLLCIFIFAINSEQDVTIINVMLGEKVDFFNNESFPFSCTKWDDRKNGKRLNSEKHIFNNKYKIVEIKDAYYISLKYATFEDSGLYTCVLEKNSVYYETTYLVDVFDILTPPTIELHYKNYNLNKCNLTLKCSLKSIKPVAFEWYGVAENSEQNQYKTIEIVKNIMHNNISCSATTIMQSLTSQSINPYDLCFNNVVKNKANEHWWDDDKERKLVTSRSIIYSILLLVLCIIIFFIIFNYYNYYKSNGVIIMPNFKQNFVLFTSLMINKDIKPVMGFNNTNQNESEVLNGFIILIFVLCMLSIFFAILKFVVWCAIKISERLDK